MSISKAISQHNTGYGDVMLGANRVYVARSPPTIYTYELLSMAKLSIELVRPISTNNTNMFGVLGSETWARILPGNQDITSCSQKTKDYHDGETSPETGYKRNDFNAYGYFSMIPILRRLITFPESDWKTNPNHRAV